MAPKTDVIAELRARVAELEYQLNTEIGSYASAKIAELEEAVATLQKLNGVVLIEELRTQLLSAQAEIKRLRDALNQWIGIASNCSIESGCCCCGESIENHSSPMMCGHSPVDMADSVVRKAIEETDAALAKPSDTSALDAYVAEKVKEYQKHNGILGREVKDLTRQRDLAVEVAQECAGWLDSDDPFERESKQKAKALSTIKESEVK